MSVPPISIFKRLPYMYYFITLRDLSILQAQNVVTISFYLSPNSCLQNMSRTIPDVKRVTICLINGVLYHSENHYN